MHAHTQASDLIESCSVDTLHVLLKLGDLLFQQGSPHLIILHHTLDLQLQMPQPVGTSLEPHQISMSSWMECTQASIWAISVLSSQGLTSRRMEDLATSAGFLAFCAYCCSLSSYSQAASWFYSLLSLPDRSMSSS